LVTPGATSSAHDGVDLAAFVSELARSWPIEPPEQTIRTLSGTLVFADISGFTRLTERLATKGRIGAEEMSDHLDAVLSPLLTAAYERGGWLVKWGGDALLLMFDTDDHPHRGAAAAAAMRSELQRVGSLATSVGRVRLRMSIGMHRGDFTFHLVGHRHRELLITGAAATLTSRLEAAAEAGEILMSTAMAALLPAGSRGAAKGEGVLLARSPEAPLGSKRTDPAPTRDVSELVPELVLQHLASGGGSEEHRTVAVAFLEFTGLDQLGSLGGDAVQTLVEVAQEGCHRHRVSFHETDISPDGGKIMLVAGAPLGLEDPADAMLWTLRQIFDEPSALSLRAGVTMGRAFTGSVGPPLRRSYSVKGDVVNLAARIMGKTASGEIWATPAVIDSAQSQFELRTVPPFTVKGKSAPVSVGSVRRAIGRRVGTSRHLPLIGRAAEMRTVTAALADARAGRGAHIDLVGPAGIGKTRILTELRAAADDTTITITADLYRSAAPYSLIRPLLAAALGIDADTVVALAEQLDAWCLRRAPELAPWLPLLAPLLDTPIAETVQSRDIAPEFRVERTHALVDEVLQAALTQPTVLIVDNLQFADEASVALLRQIADSVEGRPWLVVLADRIQRESASQRPSSDTVLLSALDADDCTTLVHLDTEDEPLAPHVIAAVVRRAGGNPLFLRQLTATRPSISDADELPDSIESVVAARIDGLRPASRQLLRAVAVGGISVDRDLVVELLDSTAEETAALVQHLEAFLVADDSRLTFRQPVIRDTAYESTPFRRRAALHGRLAELLTARNEADKVDSDEFWAVLSLHHFRAGQYDRAFPAARTAGGRAEQAHANAEAALLYRRALAAAGPAAISPAVRAEVLEHLGDVEWRLGEYASSDRSYSTASRLLRDDPIEVARIGIKRARSAERRGEYELELGRIRRVQKVLRVVADDSASGKAAIKLRVGAESRAGFAQFRRGQLKRARAHFRAVVEHGDEPRDPEVLADALAMLDVVERNLGLAPDGRRARQAVGLYEQLGDLAGQGRVWTQIGYGAYFDGRWDEAVTAYEQGRALFERVGDVPHVAVNDANLAEIYLDQGHLDQAETALRGAIRVWRASGADNDVAFGHTLLGRVLARQGRYSEAQALLEQARARFHEQGAMSEVVDADTSQAECWQLQGLAAEALELAGRTLITANRLSPQPVQAPLLHRIIGACHDALGDWARGDKSYQQSLDAARRRGADHEITMTVAAMAQRARRADRPFDPALIAEVTPLQRRLGLVVELQ
jgi:class 3 adenylate cyclase/tetratricopeptide (TPR) repeat protein